MIELLKGTNLGGRFLLELLALVALGYWGFQSGKGPLLKALLGLGAPLVAAVVWSQFGSPKAPFPLTGLSRLALEAAVMGSAAVALNAAGRPALAGAFGLVVLANKMLLCIWAQ